MTNKGGPHPARWMVKETDGYGGGRTRSSQSYSPSSKLDGVCIFMAPRSLGRIPKNLSRSCVRQCPFDDFPFRTEAPVPGLPQEQAKHRASLLEQPHAIVAVYRSSKASRVWSRSLRVGFLTGEMNLPPTIDKNGVRPQNWLNKLTQRSNSVDSSLTLAGRRPGLYLNRRTRIPRIKLLVSHETPVNIFIAEPAFRGTSPYLEYACSAGKNITQNRNVLESHFQPSVTI